MKKEQKIIQYSVISFWGLYWLFNVIDKFVGEPVFLWVGKDRVPQFINYFASIGIDNPAVAWSFFVVVTIAEIVALLFLLIAFIKLVKGDELKARKMFFWGTVTGLVIFTFFALGDQMFGDRAELLEHSTYWMALLISWRAYTYLPENSLV